MDKGSQTAAIGEAVLTAILGRQNGAGSGGRNHGPRVADHPVPLIEHRNALADNAVLFQHQLHAAEITGSHVVVVNGAGDAPLHLPHQQQHVVLIERRAVKGVEPFKGRHHAAGTRPQTRAHRQVLFQHHFEGLEFQAALLQRLAIGHPAVIEDILFRIVRQLVGVAAHG